jgi:hypothetical protein
VRTLRGTDELLKTVVAREQALLRRLFAGKRA